MISPKLARRLLTCGQRIRSGALLGPTSPVRPKDGKRVATDGPNAEVKEQLSRYYIVDAYGIHEASAIAERICRLHTLNHGVNRGPPRHDSPVIEASYQSERSHILLVRRGLAG